MNIAVIFAGGSGNRMHTKSRPKQFLEYNGKPIIIYTLELFDNHPMIDGIVVVCIESWIPFLEKMLKKFEINKVRKIVPGGESGQDSIYNGLVAAKEVASGEGDIVLIHDGVRPFVSEETIGRCFEAARNEEAAIPVMPVVETLRRVESDGQSHNVSRSCYRSVQTPQCFRISLARAAFSQPYREDFTDDASVVEAYGHKVAMVAGNRENIKLTTPFELKVAEALLNR